MSVPDRRTLSLTGRGEWPSRAESSDANPPEQSVDEGAGAGAGAGRIEVKSERSAFDIGGLDTKQLALELAPLLALQMQPPPPELPFFGELADDWYQAVAPKRVSPIGEAVLLTHLRPLYLENELSLTVAMITELLEKLLSDGYSPSTVNKVRGTGKRVVDHAMSAKRWTGPNPFALARRKREPERKYEILTLEELKRVEAKLPEHRRRMFRVALHLGLRTGELLSLRKEDVDFEAGTVHIHRSHGRDQTKTGTERLIPIPPGCAGDLLEASLATPSELLFPDEDGELQRRDTKLTRVLRTAMAKAGVGIVSVTYKCRRRGCEAKPETHGSSKMEKLDCMRCGMRLWPVPEVRPIRWYDLRHMCATFHHAAKADEVCVAKALGHSITGMTRSVYTHPTMEQMRRELTKWRLP